MTAPKSASVAPSPPARISPSGSETRKRSEQVLVRFTPDELVEARAMAAAHSLSVPELLRAALAGRTSRGDPPWADDEMIITIHKDSTVEVEHLDDDGNSLSLIRYWPDDVEVRDYRPQPRVRRRWLAL